VPLLLPSIRSASRRMAKWPERVGLAREKCSARSPATELPNARCLSAIANPCQLWGQVQALTGSGIRSRSAGRLGTIVFFGGLYPGLDHSWRVDEHQEATHQPMPPDCWLRFLSPFSRSSLPARHRHRHSSEGRKLIAITLESCSRSAGICVLDALETVNTMRRNMHFGIRPRLG
jgi:hypothetical protein